MEEDRLGRRRLREEPHGPLGRGEQPAWQSGSSMLAISRGPLPAQAPGPCPPAWASSGAMGLGGGPEMREQGARRIPGSRASEVAHWRPISVSCRAGT